MSGSPGAFDVGSRREAVVIAAMTVVGGMLRLWSIGRLGLVHFDEGIYAMAGTWVISPRGLAGLDPTLISYSPPGYPVLVGLAYGLLGVGDIPAILVSIVAGTLTIPVVGWLGYRTFGRGAGGAASAFAAMAGPHIGFSRMALTDASFLLAWLVAIGLGQRFVERPGPWRALAFGISVGVAQLFKYNGWLAGAAIATTVALWTAIRRDDQRLLALWGWGALAAVAAALVYWPWFRFVEAHGGYGALLAHQRGYLGGFDAWPSHALVQFQHERAMSGGFAWMLLTGLAGSIALLIASGELRRGRGLAAVEVLAALSLPAYCGFPAAFLLFAYVWGLTVFLRIRTMTPAVLVLAVGGWLLAILTPFYHPYARLFLPLQAFCWLLMADTYLNGRAIFEAAGARGRPFLLGASSNLILMTILIWGCALALPMVSTYWTPARTIGEVLGPSDTLRRACGSIAVDAQGDRSPLRLYARPPVTFYLSGAVPVAPQSSEQALFDASDRGAMALLDMAMMGQGGGAGALPPVATEQWELVREYPSTMNLPTLLDVDPSAAVDAGSSRSAPLRLYRPKRAPGTSR